MSQPVRTNGTNGRPGGDYWVQSRGPLASLFFVAPLLVLYEGGNLLLGPTAVRNGADVWMQQVLDVAGFRGHLLVPVVAVLVLLAWHHTTRRPWRVSAGVVYLMAVESALLAVFLVVLAYVQAAVLSVAGVVPPAALDADAAARSLLRYLVRYCGAGIYEEMLFRLILLPAILGAITWAGGQRGWAKTGAIVLTSLLFALAHYVGSHGEPFQPVTFLFRFAAGGMFGVLFVFRGFGVVVGTHALYDIIVAFPA